jgi:hypothetical protein
LFVVGEDTGLVIDAMARIPENAGPEFH